MLVNDECASKRQHEPVRSGMNNPSVSVVIPTFNRADTIEVAIRSVLDQGFPGTEIVVVDDGSTDETALVLKEYADSGQIAYFRQENKGPSSARNRGILHSRADYICFLDADDVLFPESIRERFEVFKKHPELGLVFTDNRKIIRTGSGKTLFRENDLRETNFIEETLFGHIRAVDGDVYLLTPDIYYELVTRSFIWTGTVMVKRSVFDEVGYFSESMRIAEDHDLWIRISRRSLIGFLNKSTAEYVLHEGGITQNRLLYYDSSRAVCSQYMDELPAPYRKRVRQKMAHYCFLRGYYLYQHERYPEARLAFRQASREDPSMTEYHLYSLLTMLPEMVIRRIRKFKKSMAVE